MTKNAPAVPPVDGVSAVPLLRPDGTICDTPGYDAGAARSGRDALPGSKEG